MVSLLPRVTSIQGKLLTKGDVNIDYKSALTNFTFSRTHSSNFVGFCGEEEMSSNRFLLEKLVLVTSKLR
jgi:hypothetical protein